MGHPVLIDLEQSMSDQKHENENDIYHTIAKLELVPNHKYKLEINK